MAYDTARLMSVYPKYFIEPICSKSKQTKFKENSEYDKLAHVPTKPAKNDDSMSIFNDQLVNKMINYITKGGNKKLARQLLEDGFEIIKRKQIERNYLAKDQGLTVDPYTLISQAVENCRPLMQLTAIKRGGVTYMVPVPITDKRSYFIAMKWILEAAREKERKVHFPEKFALEVIDAAYGQGRVIKRKLDLHKQCESNRAYAHYRWS